MAYATWACCEKALQTLVNQGVLKGATTVELIYMNIVYLVNKKNVKFCTAIHQTKGILDYVLTDVWGPTKNVSLGGKRWFVTFIDDYSRRV